MKYRTKFIINRIVNLFSYGLFGFFAAINNITLETGLFWILLGCMVINQITSMLQSDLRE